MWGGSVTDPSGPDEGNRGVSFLCAQYVLTVSIALFLLVLSPFVYSCVVQLVPMIMWGLFFCSKTEQVGDKYLGARLLGELS